MASPSEQGAGTPPFATSAEEPDRVPFPLYDENEAVRLADELRSNVEAAGLSPWTLEARQLAHQDKRSADDLHIPVASIFQADHRLSPTETNSQIFQQLSPTHSVSQSFSTLPKLQTSAEQDVTYKETTGRSHEQSAPARKLEDNDGHKIEKVERPASYIPPFWQFIAQAAKHGGSWRSIVSTTSDNGGQLGITTAGGIRMLDNSMKYDDDSNGFDVGSNQGGGDEGADNRDSEDFRYDDIREQWAETQIPKEATGLKSPFWARSVQIDEYVVIEGDNKGVGGYVVWLVRVGMMDGGDMVIRKRYSQFETLRNQMIATFPRAGSSLPQLPPKSAFYKFRPSFLEKRRIGLAYFLNCVLLNPEFSASPAVRDFVFDREQ